MNLDAEFKRICDLVRKAKSERPQPWVAAFDADGTLWDIDLGELFFEYQINHCGLKLPGDPWGHYHSEKLVDPRKAYLWLAQINDGIKEAQVNTWAEEAFSKIDPFPFLKFQKKLISFLRNEGVEIYIVTASIHWAVVPGGKRLGVSADHILGVRTKVKNGIMTVEQDGPVTWREGKATTLLERTNGIRPILASGNTTGDTSLIETASHARIAVLSQKPGEHLYETEMELQREAQSRGWIALDLSDDTET